MDPPRPPSTDCDLLVVGGGIAGASLGATLAESMRVVLVEAESHCGFHATGRSAAFWLESYGGPLVAPLAAASREFLERPPPAFSERGFLSPRGAIHISSERLPEVPHKVVTRELTRAELERQVPGIGEKWQWAILEPGCSDIDVAALHAAYLRQLRRAGGTIRTDAGLVSAERIGGRWRAVLANGEEISAPWLVNAGGAWADEVARMAGLAPMGIAPKRRTMVQLRIGRAGLRHLPLVADAAGTFYFKGESENSIWLSPHDEIDSDPCDAAPEEIDVAIAIDRLEQVVDWPIERVERSWAGLRSFAPDRLPIFGFDPSELSFFWCAGQGGFGIQTAPAAADLAAAILTGTALPQSLQHIDPERFSPARFR